MFLIRFFGLFEIFLVCKFVCFPALAFLSIAVLASTSIALQVIYIRLSSPPPIFTTLLLIALAKLRESATCHHGTLAHEDLAAISL